MKAWQVTITTWPDLKLVAVGMLWGCWGRVGAVSRLIEISRYFSAFQDGTKKARKLRANFPSGWTIRFGINFSLCAEFHFFSPKAEFMS